MGCGSSVQSTRCEAPPIPKDAPEVLVKNLEQKVYDLGGGPRHTVSFNGNDGDPLATSKLGINLRGLRRIRAILMKLYGDEFWSMSTVDVNTKWVEVVTLTRRCRLLEIEELVDPQDVAAPQYFISHTWKNRISRLFDYVLGYLQDASDDVTVWLDILSVNQHEDTLAHSFDVHPHAFRSTVSACTAGTLVVMDRERCSPATRCWCIFEWANAISLHGPDGFHIRLNPEDRLAVFNSIDVEKADCFKPEDKVTILSEVVQQYGTPQAFNNKLKLQIMLEPLSYRIDVRRLTQRAEASGTVWELGPVREWLGSSRRMLVVVAGAGEGKSTLSAVLATSPETAGLVTAYHFLKHSDSRRTEPIRIIKSLAFQLAERIPEFCTAVLRLPVTRVAQMVDVAEAFEQLVLQPLQEVAELWRQPRKGPPPAAAGLADAPDSAGSSGGADSSSNSRCSSTVTAGCIVLLLDALDESDPSEQQAMQQQEQLQQQEGQGAGGGSVDGGTGGASGGAGVPACPVACGNHALQLVTQHLSRLPDCVRFICTTRPSAAAGQVVPCLERTFGPGGVQLVSPSQLRSAKAGAGAPAGARPAAEAAPGGAGGGVMVYHTVRAAAVAVAAAGGVAQHTPATGQRTLGAAAPNLADGAGGTVGQVPKQADVDRLFALILERTSQCLGGTAEPGVLAAVGDLVSVVMAAREPLSQSFIQQLGLGASIPHLPGHPVLYFVDEHHLYTVHKSLGDWLLAECASGRTSAIGFHPALGHALIGLHLAKAWQQHRQQQPQSTALESANGAYTLKYMIAHLAAAADALLPCAGLADSSSVMPLSTHASRIQLLASQSASALDALLVDFVLLRAILEAGHGPAVISALGCMRRHTVYSNDTFRWLRAELFDLQQLPTVDALLRRALLTVPVKAALHLHVVGEAQQAWRTVGTLPELLGQWPSCEAVLKGHTNYVNNVAFSPDGKQCASASHDKTIRIYSVATGRCLALLQGHTSFVRSVSYSRPDGRQLASTGGDGTVRLWDCATGQCTAVLEGHTSYGTSVAFTPCGRRLVSGSGDNTIRVWDVATGTCSIVLTGHTDSIRCVVVSPDGARIASGSRDGTARVWCLVTGTCLTVLGGHGGNVAAVAFSPDGSLIATGAGDNLVRLWDGGSYERKATLEGHTSYVTSVAFLPAGSKGQEAAPAGGSDNSERLGVGTGGLQLASGSDDNSVRVWDLCTGRTRATLLGHRGYIRCVAFSRDGALLASASWDNSVRLWDYAAALRSSAGSVPEHTSSVSSLCFTADGSRILSGSGDRSIRVWDFTASGGEVAATLYGHTNSVNAVAASRDGRLYASGSHDNGVAIWSAQSGECLATLRGHTDYVTTVAFSANGKRMVSGSHDEVVRVWDVESRTCIVALQGHKDSVRSVAFDAAETAGSEVSGGAGTGSSGDGGGSGRNSGDVVASASWDRTVRVWSVSAGTCLAVLQGHSNYVVCLAFVGNSIVSGSWDGTLRVWDVAAGSCRLVLHGHTGLVTSVCTSRDGTRVFSGGSDHSVCEWDIAAGVCAATHVGHAGAVTSLSMSTDGRRLASGSTDNTIRVWDASSGSCEAVLLDRTKNVSCVAVSEEPEEPQQQQASRRIFCGTWDGKLRVYTAQGELLRVLVGHTRNVSCVALTLDGRTAVSGSWDCTLRVWDLASQGGGSLVLAGHTRNVSCAAVSPDGRLAVSGSWDGTLRVWDFAQARREVQATAAEGQLEEGRPGQGLQGRQPAAHEAVHVLLGHARGVSSVAFSADGSLLASGSDDGTLRLWATASWQCCATIDGNGSPVTCVAFSPRANPHAAASDARPASAGIGQQAAGMLPERLLLASGGVDGLVKVWDVSSGECVLELGHSLGVAVRAVACSPDGSVVASGGDDAAVRMWDAATGACVAELCGHVGCVTGIAFSAGGTVVYTSSDDNCIRMWVRHSSEGSLACPA